MLIQASTQPGDVVLDCTAATGILFLLNFLFSLLKPCKFFYNLLFGCTKPSNIPCYAGASIHACRNVNRHIAALEPDNAIFEALLAPLIRTASAPLLQQESVTGLDDMDGEEVVIEKIVKKSRFSKWVLTLNIFTYSTFVLDCFFLHFGLNMTTLLILQMRCRELPVSSTLFLWTWFFPKSPEIVRAATVCRWKCFCFCRSGVSVSSSSQQVTASRSSAVFRPRSSSNRWWHVFLWRQWWYQVSNFIYFS